MVGMQILTGAQVLVQCLAKNGIDALFGLPGGHNLGIYNAAFELEGMKVYSGRNEQGTGYMAHGYAKANGKPACLFTTAGPGITNIVTPIAHSYVESVQMLVVAVNNFAKDLDEEWGVFHELPNVRGLFAGISAYTARVNRPEEIPLMIQRASMVMRENRPRPVVLEVPSDVLIKRTELPVPEAIPVKGRRYADDQTIRELVDEICQAKRPVLLVGGGAVASGAEKNIRKFSELLNIPVVTTVNGRGVLPEDHPNALGVLWERVQSHDAFAREADLVLAVGTSLSLLATRNGQLPLPKKLIHIDTDLNVIGRAYQPMLGILGDADAVMGQVLQVFETDLVSTGAPKFSPDELSQLKGQWQAHLESKIPEVLEILQAVREGTPRNAQIICDMTIPGYWMERFLPVYATRTLQSAYYFGTLGYALPSALGAKIAHPKEPVLAVIGDGGILFNIQELATAVSYQLPIVVLLFNDNCYSAIKSAQRSIFKQEKNELHDLQNPDFLKLAAAFGWETIRSSKDTLTADVKKAFTLNQPVLVEIQDVSLPLHNDVKW